MSPGLLLDVTQIPDKLSGLATVSGGIATTMLIFLVPFTIVELNVRGLNPREQPNYGAFFARLFTVAVCLLCYKRLFGFILKASQLVGFAVLSEQQWGDFLTQTLRGSDSSFPTLSILLHSATSIQEIVLFLSSLVAVTARDVVVMLQGCFLSLLFAFGPIALVCAVNEKTSQVTRGWLANSFQVALWSFFLRMVVRVWLTLNPLAANSGSSVADDYLGMLAVNVSFLLMVLGTPVVAARLLSGANIAAFGEAAFGAMQTVAVARQLKVGKFVSSEAERYHQAPRKDQRNLLQFPVRASMTRTYERFFGRIRPQTPPQGKASQS